MGRFFFDFGLEKPLSVQSLVGCGGKLEDDAENCANDGGLACEVSGFLKDHWYQSIF